MDRLVGSQASVLLKTKWNNDFNDLELQRILDGMPVIYLKPSETY